MVRPSFYPATSTWAPRNPYEARLAQIEIEEHVKRWAVDNGLVSEEEYEEELRRDEF